jgi:hypothetical protein
MTDIELVKNQLMDKAPCRLCYYGTEMKDCVICARLGRYDIESMGLHDTCEHFVQGAIDIAFPSKATVGFHVS